MATAAAATPKQPGATSGVLNIPPALEDPFLSEPSEVRSQSSARRGPSLENRIFGLNASSSPLQAKRAIEAHLAETDRRLQDAGRLGSTLVHQRQELVAKLNEMDKRKDDDELPPGLRETLAEIEKEYDDVGRETARALLSSRSRNVNSDNYPVESSPAIFSSHGNVSPSKVSAPARKQRNQPTGRSGDIQFAADISSSLLVQVRQLQSALAERDESLRSTTAEKSRLEREMEGFTQRLRALDESEQRYKDENWNLETQTHEMLAAAKEGADRDKKLNATLAAALAEKRRLENDLDEVRVSHGKLSEDHTAVRKIHDSELHSLQRNLDMADHDRDELHRKVGELTSQNQELANAIASRSRTQEHAADEGRRSEPEDDAEDVATPENSPPPSPIKATPRHGALETETLKSSLHHAHRMIQNLKGNIHREKTEKIELKRMLQDARDEVEQRRSESGALGSGNKRQRTKPEPFKKPARRDMLGGSRKTRTDFEIDEPDWEDHAVDGSPSHTAASRYSALARPLTADHGYNANDTDHTSTDADFETANERGTTESEDFQTGAESLAADSTDESTETETGLDRWNSIRGSKRSIQGNVAGNRSSYLSTASTSAGEDETDRVQPMATQPLRYRLKMGRGANARRSQNSVETTPVQSLIGARDSPASWGSSPPSAEQNLFAELGELNGGGSEFSTPGRASILSSRSTPATAHVNGRQVSTTESHQTISSPKTTTMIDQGMMTEPWIPETPPRSNAMLMSGLRTSLTSRYSLQDYDLPPASPSDFPLPPSMTPSPSKSDLQHTPLRIMQESPMRGGVNFITPPKTIWDEAQDQEATGHDERISPPALPVTGFSPLPAERQGQPLKHASGFSNASPIIPWSFSSIMTQETIPIEPAVSIIPSSATDVSEGEEQRPATAHATVAGAAGVGLLASVGTALGLSAAKRPQTPITENGMGETLDDQGSELQRALSSPINDKSSENASNTAEAADPVTTPLTFVPTSDQGSQTALTSEEIDSVFTRNDSKPPPASGASQPPTLPPIVTSGDWRPAYVSRMPATDPDPPTILPMKRPGSAASQHPPLPPDHKDVITKAKGRLSTSGMEPPQASTTTGNKVMGPPIAPASAYRRPRTPGDQSFRSPTRGSTTPRVNKQDGARASSQRSRRSSVSSFASELDERFNIRADGLPANQSISAGPETDPQMIQAITQTMIGEFLWKYTRKRGRPDMSNTRHRRYFWVHPYTRTLYWSEQDPQSAGGKELKAKSVAIESVRVVVDDNHLPPGLHGKSLEVVTPGRRIRFTAGTASRHNTWFNALSYLLMRGQDDSALGNSGAGSNVEGNGLTSADVDEFNPSSYTRDPRLGAGTASRASLSSYHSHTTRGTSQSRASYARPTMHSGGPGPSRASSATPASLADARALSATPTRMNGMENPGVEDTVRPSMRQGSISRFSSMFRASSIRDSFSVNHRPSFARHSDSTTGGDTITSRSARNTQASSGSIYNASVVGEGEDARRSSAEEMRRELQRQEREGLGKLENVRACCDGKHDVSDLAHHHHHHHHPHHNTNTNSNTNANARSSSASSNRHSNAHRPSSSNNTPTLTTTRNGRQRSLDRWASSVSSRTR